MKTKQEECVCNEESRKEIVEWGNTREQDGKAETLFKVLKIIDKSPFDIVVKWYFKTEVKRLENGNIKRKNLE